MLTALLLAAFAFQAPPPEPPAEVASYARLEQSSRTAVLAALPTLPVVTAQLVDEGEPVAAPVGGFFVRLLPHLHELLALLLTAVLLPLLRKWLASKAETSVLAKAALKAEEVASSVVAQINAVLKPKLAKAAEDGVITEAEAAQMKSEALAQVRSLLGPKLLELLAKLFGGPANVDTYLGGKIEQAVLGAKVAAAKAVPAVPPSA